MMQPQKILANRLRGSKRLNKVMSLRRRKAAMPQEKPSNPEADKVAEATPLPLSSTPTIEGTAPETLTRPPTPFAVTTTTDSTLSLSSRAEASPILSPGLNSRRPTDILHSIDHHFPVHSNSTTHLSQVSTLQDSTFVHGTLSRSMSEIQPPSVEEPNGGPPIDADYSTPPPPRAEPSRPVTRPRVQTDFDQLHVPNSDDQDSQSTIRGEGIDFSQMGGLFEGSPSR
jgi:hypothetical protein